MCSENVDKARFIQFYESQIASGEIKEFKKTFEKSKLKIESLPDEKQEAKKEKAKMKDKLQAKPDSFGDLEKMILAKRNNAFGGFLNYMEDKYAKEEKPAGKKRKLSKEDAD